MANIVRKKKKKKKTEKRFEPEGSEKYNKVNNNLKRCTKKAKENWIGEQCSETEENLRKNKSKRVYQVVKSLTTVKQGKAILSKIVLKNAIQKSDRY